MAALEHGVPEPRTAALAAEVKKKAGRRLFAPGRLVAHNGRSKIEPVEYHGSGDIVGYSRGDVLFTLPAETTLAKAGEEVEYYPRGR
jgi:molybdopterin biosynthesis enzyme